MQRASLGVSALAGRLEEPLDGVQPLRLPPLVRRQHAAPCGSDSRVSKGGRGLSAVGGGGSGQAGRKQREEHGVSSCEQQRTRRSGSSGSNGRLTAVANKALALQRGIPQVGRQVLEVRRRRRRAGGRQRLVVPQQVEVCGAAWCRTRAISKAQSGKRCQLAIHSAR